MGKGLCEEALNNRTGRVCCPHIWDRCREWLVSEIPKALGEQGGHVLYSSSTVASKSSQNTTAFL